jgi:tetratricopeptide (TPR) repeat protein
MNILSISRHTKKHWNSFSNISLKQKSFSLLAFFLIFFTSVLKSQTTTATELTFWGFFKNNKLKQAEEYINDAIETNPNIYQYYFLRANLSFEIGKYEEVIKDIEKYFEVFPPSFDAYLIMGEAYMKLDKNNAAVNAFKSAAESSEASFGEKYCQLRQAEAYNKLGYFEMAQALLTNIEDVFSTNCDYLYCLGISQVNLKNREKSEETKDKLLGSCPDEENTNAFLVQYYMSTGNVAKALEALKLKIELSSDNVNDIKLLKKLANITQDTSLLIMASEKLIAKEDADYTNYLNLAKLYNSTNNFAKACSYINRAITLSNENPYCYFTKGEIYLNNNLKDRACDCYFIALKKGFKTTKGELFLKTYIKNCE